MKAWGIKHYGASSQLHLLEVPTPSISPDEVLIKIKAASVNPVDFKIRDGKLRFVLKHKFPLILGNDCAGVITQVGGDVTRFKIGDEVYSRPSKDKIGTFAEFISATESSVALKPKNLSFEEAASLPLVGLTSWQALIERGALRKGQRVFIPAGSGGVGTFAIQLAKQLGAYVITNTSGKNVDFVKSLGADEVFDYQKEDFSAVVAPVDIVLDTMGGETQRKAFSILKAGGQIISIVGPPTAAFLREVEQNILLQSVAGAWSAVAHFRAKRRNAHYKFMLMLPDGKALAEVAKLVEANKIRPVLDKIFPFSEAPKALAHVETGRSVGKVVISMN